MARLIDIMSNVYMMLDEDMDAHPTQWPREMVVEWVNDGAQELTRKTECNRDVATIPTVGGTGQYTLTQNIVRLTAVTWQGANEPSVFELEYRDRHSMKNLYWLDPNQAAHSPVYYTTWGNPPAMSLRLFPVPNLPGTLTIYYYSFPTRLELKDEWMEVDIPAGWEDALVDYAEYRALRRDRDPRWQEAYGLWREKVDDLAIAALRYNDQAGQFDWSENPMWMGEFY